MNYITNCPEFHKLLAKAEVFLIKSITINNEPLPQDTVRKCITRALFNTDIEIYDEATDTYIIEAVVDNLYVKIITPNNDCKASIIIQPVEGYSINLEREAEDNVFKTMRGYYRDNVAITVRQANSYMDNKISYYGTFRGVNRDNFTFFDTSAPLAKMLETEPTVAIVKYHNKPSSIGGLFKHSHLDRFSSNKYDDEDLMHRLSEIKKFSDPSIDDALIKLHGWYGGMVILGDFSQVIDFQFTGTSHGDYAIIGKLPHGIYDLHAWLLMDAHHNDYYLSDLEAYKVLNQSMINIGSNRIHYIE